VSVHSDVVVRRVAEDDRAQWTPLWDGYNAFYGRHGATALPTAVTDTTWQRFFDPEEPVHALVAERDGVLLGLAHYLFHRSTILVEPTCYLQDLYTAEHARGAGVGRALIAAVYDAARAAGGSRVYWQTYATNTTAMRLYDQVAERTGIVVYRKLFDTR
jgi:GNAT superfamily N-acetyltransferase